VAAASGQVLTGILPAGVVYSMPNAVWPATYAEYFPTSVRLSGMAIGTQFGFALAGFTPAIAGWLMAGDADNWVRVAGFAVALELRQEHRTPHHGFRIVGLTRPHLFVRVQGLAHATRATQAGRHPQPRLRVIGPRPDRGHPGCARCHAFRRRRAPGLLPAGRRCR